MSKSLKVCLAGPGAFGVKHLEAIGNIKDVEVVSLVGRDLVKTKAVADRFGIGHVTTDLSASWSEREIDAVILCTPTHLHAAQAVTCLRAGKHVQIEIPVADNLADAQQLVSIQQETGLIAMAGHTRRFNPSHRWIHQNIQNGKLRIQQMDVQTFFFRRTNTNALGQPRSWTDHLLWHHACHTVDLFQYQTGEIVSRLHAMQGPIDPNLGIAMDMSVQLQVPTGALCTLSLSFNNDGPIGTFFRYICDNGTYVARYDDLFDGNERKIDLSEVDISTNGIELQDRAFFTAIRNQREPDSGVARVLPAYKTLDRLEKILANQGTSAWHAT